MDNSVQQQRLSPHWLLRQVAPGIVAAAAMVMAVLLTQPVMGGAAPLVRLVSSSAVGAIAFVSVAWLALGRRLPRALIQAAAATPQESLHDGMAPLSAEAAS